MPDQTPYAAAVPGLLAEQKQRTWRSFSWITARALLSAVNDQVSRHAPAMVAELRAEWLARPAVAAAQAATDLVVDRSDCTDLVVIGDPGEQDASQYVVAAALADTVARADAAGRPITAIVVCSDVIYPSGDINDYADGSYVPYAAVERVPMYALPGNHDWYDGLTGFMWHWCGQERLPAAVYGPRQGRTASWTFRLFWRRPSRRRRRLDLAASRQGRWSAQHARAGQPLDERGRPGPLQPAPYFAIQARHVLLVCIDTGIDGSIDPDQAAWLLRVSRRPGRKVLLTGKPLCVNGEWHPCPIWSSRLVPSPVLDPVSGVEFHTVLDIVRHGPHDYVASIGGDIHNYQRYAESERVTHIVSGGGGAYLSATHTVAETRELRARGLQPPRPGAGPDSSQVRPGPLPESLFPTEAESLAHFADLFLPRVYRLARALLLVALGLLAGWLLGRSGSRPPAGPGSGVAHLPPPGTALAWAAGIVGALFTIRFALPAGAARTRWFRAGAVLNAAASGVALGLVPWWVLAGPPGAATPAGMRPADRVSWVAAGVAAGLCLAGWALRWTGWWRPARPAGPSDPLPPDRTWPAVVVGVGLLAVSAGLARVDRWVGLALLGTTATAGWGWWRGRRTAAGAPRASWARRGPVVAYVVQAADVLVVADRLLFPTARAQVVRALGTAVALPLVVVAVAVVAVLATSGALAVACGRRAQAAGGLGRLTWFRGGWGRVGWAAPWLLAVAVAGGLMVAVAVAEPAGVGIDVGLTAAVALVLTVAVPVLVDTLRRWLRLAYKAVCAAVVTGVVLGLDRTGRLSGAFPREVAAVTAVLVLLVLVVAAAHLFFLGGFVLLVDRDVRRGRPRLLTVEQAGAVLRWRLGTLESGDPAPTPRSRRRAEIVFPGVGDPTGPLQKAVSEIFDSDEPPFAKNFLVLRTTEQELSVRAVFVTGAAGAPDPEELTLPL